MKHTLTLDEARAAIDAGCKAAREIGVAMNIALVDAGNNLLAFVRMDGAWLGSIDIAQNKTYTARAFDQPTKQLGAMAEPGEPLYGIQDTNRGRIVIFAGGVPVKRGNAVVGAVGVSGGRPDQDQKVAEAAAAAITPGG
jgi:uncharacterized protein GlcG (DUF336 family)